MNGNPEEHGGETENSRLTTDDSSVTYLDILNYDIARLIRHETAEGHTIVEFLGHVLTGRDKPFTPRKLRIRQTDRMAAAKEILRRGHGHFGRRRRLIHDADDTNDYDTLHSDLARRMREYSEHGTDAARFLLDVMNDASLDPEEAYTWHHKTSAAMELLRRGWDTNFDKITPDMLRAYWQDRQTTRLSIGQKKHLAGLHTFLDEYDKYDDEDYEAMAGEMREAEAREELEEANASKSRQSRNSKKVEGQGNAESRHSQSASRIRKPTTRPYSASLPPAMTASVNPAARENGTTIDAHEKAIIQEFRQAMNEGDHQAALRARAKFVGSKIAADLRPYIAPDPNIQPGDRPSRMRNRSGQAKDLRLSLHRNPTRHRQCGQGRHPPAPRPSPALHPPASTSRPPSAARDDTAPFALTW